MGYIRLTHANGHDVIVNPEKIVMIEETGDDSLLVSLTNGDAVVVRDTVDSIFKTING